VSYDPAQGDHELTALAVGNEVALFGRSSTSQLIFKLSSGGAFSGNWTTLATGVASRPDAVLLGNDIYVFYRGTGNDLRYVRRTGTTWGAAVSLGGGISWSPAAAVDGDGDIIVTAMNSTGKVYFRRLTGGSWTGWTATTGTLAGQVSLVPHNGNLYLLGINHTGKPYSRTWSTSGNSWSGWTGLGGTLASEMTGASINGVLYAFGLNANGTSYYKTLGIAGWGGWTSLGGVLTSIPSSTASSELVYLGINPAGDLWERRLNGSWTEWAPLDGALATGAETVAVGDSVYAFAVGENAAVLYRRWNGTSWSAWTSLGGAFSIN
jgi:hypothetical protein